MGAVLVAMVTMFVWWVPVLVLGGAAAMYWLAARRAEARGAHLVARGARAAAAREGRMHDEEVERTLERDYRDLAGFGDVRGYFRLSQLCTRVVVGNVGAEADDPREMRWWAARMLALAGVFGTLGLASDVGAWLPALPVLVVCGGVAALVAQGGPRVTAVAD